MVKVQQNVKMSLNVIAKENDEQWRGVLATLYEHGSSMGDMLAKHMCENLLQSVETQC